tara:strand:+ start:341 stop:2578 length:2238 start_codon:yes stop_codon:yes gene_type:complete
MTNNKNSNKEIIINENLDVALGQRYLEYALSTITDRALPDSRDGLKPVHRRILYAMRQLKLVPSGSFRKCAKIVGEVMGNYHPHGDKAIYDSLVRMAQTFTTRYPLIEGQGNFGNIDGDNAAAQRYTEARLSEISMIMLDGLDESAVDFKDNYDGSETEPKYLPAFFPQLLANGAYGIAVGMATSIPPHNIKEILDASIKLIQNSKLDDTDLMKIVKGPDFPTGGVLVDPKSTILENYISGKGSFRIRAKYNQEFLSRGRWQIVITEIPYGIQKSKLVEKLAELINDKKINLLNDLRDESAEDIRLVLEPKSKNIPLDILMEHLFKKTDLESRFSLNMNVLFDGKLPKVSSLKDLLQNYIDNCRNILIRRSKFRLRNIDSRLHLLEGFIVTYLNLDKVISIIRFNDNPKSDLQKEFDLSELQVEAILNMRLRSLRKLEQIQLEEEKDQLLKERLGLEMLLEDEDSQWQKLSKDFELLKLKLSSNTSYFNRKTIIEEKEIVENLEIPEFIEEELVTVIISKLGWIKFVKGKVINNSEIKYREGDEERFLINAKTSDKILIFGSNGHIYSLQVNLLPSGRTNGEPIRLLTDLPNQTEIVNVIVFDSNLSSLVTSSIGDGFIIKHEDMLAQTRSGKKIINLKTGILANCLKNIKGDLIATIGTNRKLLIFKINELPTLNKGKGVRLQKYKDAYLSDITSFDSEIGLFWYDKSGRKNVVSNSENWIGKRAQSGKIAPKGFPRNNKFNKN